MSIIIHIGMHKTGSSSIQHTFAQLPSPEIEYIDWGISGNHSALYVLLFEDLENLSDYHGFKARGPEYARTLPALRKDWYARVSQQVARAGDKTVIFSAEDISSPAFESALPRLHDFFSGWSESVSAIGYARSPGGFMASAFQQILKDSGIVDLNSRWALPDYRARFDRIDRIFGPNKVSLKDFSMDCLKGGDVVQDFAHEIGLSPLAEDQIIRTNESLSLEAVALLYVQRKLGRGFVAGFDGAHAANTTFIAKLATIGRRKFAFSAQMLAPILERERDDIAWMEERLGHPFSEFGAANPDAIDSLDDLTDIALEQFDAVQDLLGEDAVDGPATTDTLVRGLERLREQEYAQVAGPQQATIDLQRKDRTDMPTKTTSPKPTAEELNLRVKLARVLWHNDHMDNMPNDIEERKAAFDAVALDYQRKALDLTRRLENNNLMIVETEPQD